MRGTFANVKLMNKLAEGKKGGWTKDLLDDQIKAVWDAAEDYQNNETPLVVLAGKMYGSGFFTRLGGEGSDAARRTCGFR